MATPTPTEGTTTGAPTPTTTTRTAAQTALGFLQYAAQTMLGDPSAISIELAIEDTESALRWLKKARQQMREGGAA